MANSNSDNDLLDKTEKKLIKKLETIAIITNGNNDANNFLNNEPSKNIRVYKKTRTTNIIKPKLSNTITEFIIVIIIAKTIPQTTPEDL
ncbi:MAG: hypothetical protein FWG70_10170 [Oscillospiraceae bacterium]|nr:hypothetical protein [Oscillospiraceae bacterium]